MYALEVVGGRFGDLHTGPDGAGYGHHLGRRVLDQRPARVPVAANHVEDAFGQELGGYLRHHHRRDRGGVRGLYHDGVAGGDSRGELPDRHHHGVVPGGHLAYDADRLAPDEGRVTFQVLARRLAFEDACGPGEEPDLVHPSRDLFFHGEPEGLAGVLGLGTHDLLRPLLYGVGDPEHGQLPLRGRGVAPRLEGPLRHPVGPVDVLLAGERRLGEHVARGRVDQVVGPAVRRLGILATHKVLERSRFRHPSSFCCWLVPLRCSAMPPRISRTILSAASAVMSAEPTSVGTTSTMSVPTTSSRMATSHTAQSSSAAVIPPGSGVPVPGAKAGSSTSMSTVRKTGPVPAASMARPMTSLIPRSLTSCMKRLVIPRSSCQANSSSPGQ